MRTLIIGLDAFDPNVFESMVDQGDLPNLRRYVDRDSYRRFQVTDPPQSEVSWTSIASGRGPADHGIFDFVHRDPRTYQPYVSLLPTERKWGNIQFAAPTHVETLFDRAAALGFPATSMWWPATFPANLGSPVRVIPGLGTPDIHGRWGVGTLFSSNPDDEADLDKTNFRLLEKKSSRRFQARLEGPVRKRLLGVTSTGVDLSLELQDNVQAQLKVGDETVRLRRGEWSELFEIHFRLGPFYTLKSLTKAIWTHATPNQRLYFLPLQIHPLGSPWHYGSPSGFMKRMWSRSGPFMTIGWPQDTTGLEEGCIDDDQFLALCRSIFDFRRSAFLDEVGQFNEGVLGAVFDSLDRIQHMFWRDNKEVVAAWYKKLDTLVGNAETVLREKDSEPVQLLIVSDHGFSSFDHKVNLNTWLIEQGYLHPQNGTSSSAGTIHEIDWRRTKAYAVGLNSLYLNLADRERDGIVQKAEAAEMTQDLIQRLRAWRGPDGRPVVQRVMTKQEVFEGSLKDHAPDLFVGYSSGYRASSDTAMGSWKQGALVRNKDHWGADHCIDSESVPGVLFARQGLGEIDNPSYRDIPQLALGVKPDPAKTFPPPRQGGEDMEEVERRLRSLGYL